ncbi:MAG: AAA family ATPase [Sulfurospirillaceae bacterium]|nr:AAA family ATPase [Sulfurospirillaceae bacterium]
MIEKIEEILKTRDALLTGGGGVGKSYLAMELVKRAKKNSQQVVTLGSTGVSAVNINGQTIHSFFAFGICSTLEELSKHDRYAKGRLSEIKKILKSCDLLIIDEISMVSANLLDMIQYRLRSAGFKGRILFIGDFFQLPPVFKSVDNSLLGNNQYAFESSAWEFIDPLIIELTKTKRTNDKKFFSILSKIRLADIDEDVIKYLKSLRENSSVLQSDATVLFARNREADDMNLKKLNELDGNPILLKAKEKLHVKTLHENKIKNWKNSLPIPCDLMLKIGAKILFCTNKWGKFYNGERGIVREIGDDYIVVEKEDSLIRVDRHEYVMSENIVLNGEIEEKPLISIEQFPIKLAYAITIHKSQGMSIDELVCNIDHIFEKSQFYVAISRAKNPKNLYIHQSNGDFDRWIQKITTVSPKVKDFYINYEVLKIEEEKVRYKTFFD